MDANPGASTVKKQDDANEDSKPPKDVKPPVKTLNRVPRACNACRKQKMRCEGADNPPCRRCRHAGLECLFEKPSREATLTGEAGLERIRSLEAHVADIRHTQAAMHSMLTELVGHLRNGAYAARSPSVYPPTYHNQSPSMQSPSLATPPAGHQHINDIQATNQARGQLPNQTYQSPQAGPISPAVDYHPPQLPPSYGGYQSGAQPYTNNAASSQGPVLPPFSSISTNMGPPAPQQSNVRYNPADNARGHPPRPHSSATKRHAPPSNVTSADSSDVEDEDNGDLPASGLVAPWEVLRGLADVAIRRAARENGESSEPQSRTRTPSPDRQTRPAKRRKIRHKGPTFPDVVTKNILSDHDARELFRIFYHGCSTFLPVFDVNTDSYDALHERSPFAVDCICMVAAKVRDGGGKPSEIYLKCLEEVQKISCATLFSPVTRHEAVQAMILVSGWSDNGWLSGGHAIRMAMELSMHKAWPRLHRRMQAGKFSATDDRNLVIASRTWFCLYLFEHQLSYGTGRPAVLKDDDSIANCRMLLQHPLAIEDDMRLVSTVELMALRERLHNQMSDLDAPPTDATFEALRAGSAQFQGWFATWDQAFSQKYEDAAFYRQSLQNQQLHAELFHNATALRGINSPDDVQKMPPAQRELALRSISTARQGLDITVNSPSYREGMKYAVHYTHVTATFTASFLLRLARLFPNDCNLSEIRSQVERLADLMSQIPAKRYALTLQVMLKRSKKRKDSQSLSPKATREPQTRMPIRVDHSGGVPSQHRPAENFSPTYEHGTAYPTEMQVQHPMHHHHSHQVDGMNQMHNHHHTPSMHGQVPGVVADADNIWRSFNMTSNEQLPVWISDQTLGGNSFTQSGMDAFILPTEYLPGPTICELEEPVNAISHPYSTAPSLHDASNPEVMHTTKKQKTSNVNEAPPNLDSDSYMDVDVAPSVPPSGASSSKRVANTTLKGRKRFKADLADLEEDVQQGVVTAGNFTLSKCRAGDDEGSIDLVIQDTSNPGVKFHINLFVSDTSDYPLSHTLFAACSSSDVPQSVQDAVESVASSSSRPVQDVLQRLLSSISSSSKRGDTSHHTDESEDEGSDAMEDFEDYEDYDYDVAPKSSRKGESANTLPRISSEFMECVASGYRPGLVRLTSGDICLSVSIPIVTLSKSIPPRVLVAWDRRLLRSKSQHLTLLISGFRGTYPPLTPDGTYTSEASHLGTTITFKVGLSRRYKASLEEIEQAFRTFGLIAKDEPPVAPTDIDAMDSDPPEFEEDGRFTPFSLSSSLENLLNGTLLKVIQYRRKFGFGWAAAELLYSLVEKNQTLPQAIVESNLEALLAEDAQEAELAQTYDLPDDPLSNLAPSADLNLPMIAFSYLIRRLLFVSRYCVVCHNKTSAEYETLKPYVCENKLCSYQYYAYNQGPSLEYEIIHNTTVVDLLVSLAYSSAAEDSMDDPLPVGMDLLVPSPTNNYGLAYAPTPKSASANRQAPTSSLQRFDDLNKSQMRRAIVSLIDALPPITSMKKHLLQPVKPGQSKPKLKDLDPSIPAAAWSILRWCIASCTADLEQLEGESLIGNVDNSWRQFRFSVGAPDAEAKFKTAIAGAQQRNANTRAYPTLYAFHGSPLKNWHSIIRHGLWYKEIIHGRAYGNGVYLAKDGQISMSTYAQPKVVNIPSEFVSSNPYYVVAQTSWIMCRYLLVKGSDLCDAEPDPTVYAKAPSVRLDPTTPVTLNSTQLDLPEPTYQIDRLIEARKKEFLVEDNDVEDENIFRISNEPVVDLSSQPVEDWTPDPEYVRQAVANLMPPPLSSTSSATSAVQRELREMLKEQNAAKKRPGGLKSLGWYLPDLSEDGDDADGGGIMDNLFQWIVEVHSFDDGLPLSQDMKKRGINSLLFEIRFPPNFPHAPPFFRLITPRFLGFSQGGGGHVTLGGSICMDLLTADGWLPSYNISSVLLQIRMALSNLDPFPAKLSNDWDRPYGIMEALDGYKRAARVHGWQVPKGLDALAR